MENIENTNGYKLSSDVVDLLAYNKMTISSAESCTGGMFAKMITDIPGSSRILNEAYVTYSNEIKTKILGVKKETLDKYGAVSEQTANEMVEGLKRVTGCDVCVCFTGIAGPGGGSEQKPVGLVYAGLIVGNEKNILKLNLEGTRDEVRTKACITLFELIKKKLL